ncbi:MAG: hypothetical protein KatS3mg076_3112 [Candidatus Binatia bacterium]|nr:MAG: hypothetical protein KatS3mg076_3112 [Candidatus Binatia bacterium]
MIQGGKVRTIGRVSAVLALLAGSSFGPRWTHAETVPAQKLRQNLFYSCFVSAEEGWVVGDLGMIFHTTDGAKTWEIQRAGTKRPFVAVTCPERNRVWVAGQAGQIAHSRDQGRTWTFQESGTDRQLLDIVFVDSRRGLAVGDYGIILRTDNGGETWTRIPMPTEVKLPPDIAEVVQPGDVLLYKVAFANPEEVWIVGEFGVILHSSDGGLTWESQESPVETTLFGVHFTDPLNGWATGIESTLIRTEDGGQTWRRVRIETPPDFFIPPGFSLSIYDVDVRGRVGWAVGDSGFLVNSTDGGKSWKMVRVPTILRSSWLRDVNLLPTGQGYIVGARGTVLSVDTDRFTMLKQRK